MLLWRSWEPEPWQPSAQISVGRELAGKIHARCAHAHTHTCTDQSISVCSCQTEANPLDPDRHRCLFIGWPDRIEVFLQLVLYPAGSYNPVLIIVWTLMFFHDIHANNKMVILGQLTSAICLLKPSSSVKPIWFWKVPWCKFVVIPAEMVFPSPTNTTPPEQNWYIFESTELYLGLAHYWRRTNTWETLLKL